MDVFVVVLVDAGIETVDQEVRTLPQTGVLARPQTKKATQEYIYIHVIIFNR